MKPFYGGLGEREPIAAAYAQGCAAISLQGPSDRDRPQLAVRPGIDAGKLVLAADPVEAPSSQGSTDTAGPSLASRHRPRPAAPPQVDIGILTIRDDEFRAVLQMFPTKAGTVPGAHREYTLRHAEAGDGERYTITVLRQVEQGLGEAQTVARDLIEDLAPRLVLVVGIAGGLPSDEVTLGDVVLSTRIHDFTVEARKAGHEVAYAAAGGPIDKTLANAVADLANREDVLGNWTADLPARPAVAWTRKGQLEGPPEWQRELRAKLEHHHGKGATPRAPVYAAGPIASSDRLVKDPAVLIPWLTTARNLLAVEMESGGVYRAVRERCPMLAIRGISDIVGLKRADAWTKYACASAAAFTRAFLRTRPIELTAAAGSAMKSPHARSKPDPLDRQAVDERTDQTSTAGTERLPFMPQAEVAERTARPSEDTDERVHNIDRSLSRALEGVTPETAVSTAEVRRRLPGGLPVVWGWVLAVSAFLGVITGIYLCGATADMVPIPSDTFQMGSPAREGRDDEHPPHRVTLSAYFIDRTEVTVKAYAACVAAGHCSAAPLTVTANGQPGDDVTRRSQYCNGDDRPDDPINCVDWTQAALYCTWMGKRLPTEAEWEYAARGREGYIYPWGKPAPSAERLNACGSECRTGETGANMYNPGDGYERTAPVGSFPHGASPFHALDMAGNVWEWTDDWYGPYPSVAVSNPSGAQTGMEIVIRGGAWNVDRLAEVRTAYRSSKPPSFRGGNVGFRCARRN